MLSTAGGHALFIGTPKGFDHLYDSYREGQPGATDEDGHPITDHKSWLYTTEQGGLVPQAEIAAARRSMDTRAFRQEYQASFETFEGRVLYAFSRVGNCRPCAYDPALPVEIGMDFNINPMSAVVLQPHGEEDWLVGEVILRTSNTDEMVTEIKRRYARAGGVGHITIYPDPAGAQRRTSAQGRTDISILRAAGFQVVAMSSHPLVRDRTNTTNARFQTADGTRRLFVDPSCKVAIEAFERHVYKDGTSEPDKATGHDHPCDGLGYWAFGKYDYKPKAPARSVPAARFMQV
jgi:hypothetical protein